MTVTDTAVQTFLGLKVCGSEFPPILFTDDLILGNPALELF